MTKYTKIVPVRMTEELWQQIKALAKSQGRTASDLIRWIVNTYLERNKNE